MTPISPQEGLSMRAPPDFSVQFWSKERGFSGAEGRAIAETPDGNLWFGTTAGLIRSNGLLLERLLEERAPWGYEPVACLCVNSNGELV